MPIVDGLTSTKMIRAFEKSPETTGLSSLAALNGRVPIFAVSASLVEREKPTYVEAGFDGWILKPIDFRRLNTLLQGIVEEDTRKSCLYETGQWERGGWFKAKPACEKPGGSADPSQDETPKADVETPGSADTEIPVDHKVKDESAPAEPTA